MSFYTDNEHEKGRIDTLYWQSHKPQRTADFFKYGEYCYRLYEFKEAVAAYTRAAVQNEIGALFQLGRCFTYGYGTHINKEIASGYFNKVLSLGSEQEPRCRYYIGMCYLYGYNVNKDEQRAWHLLDTCSEKNAAASYEQGLFFVDGKNNFAKDIAKAVFYLRRAYDMGEENAVFAMEELFKMHDMPYPDPIELTQAYSWRLGRIIRAAEKNPCSEYYLRLAQMYRTGFPNDTAANREKFLRAADEYEKLAGTSTF
ncbi:tetratricopeptide repeat protein [Pectinatus frisingensis]|uniref:tetratricopeptide repeat protein n=1 Tax=Pectinatus frisingensis TaxID=865 RepID=UPI0018C5FB91|nr:sel1 repeat family protein [Pectinatus frisingensis]